MEKYEVRKGDTLWSIAKKLLGDGAKYNEIQRANGMKDTLIQPGQVLKIPAKHSPSFEEIGKAFEKAVKDVDNLPSVRKLYELIGD